MEGANVKSGGGVGGGGGAGGGGGGGGSVDAGNAMQLRVTWEEHFNKTPCVRSAYLTGLGCGSVMFAHKIRLHPKSRMSNAFGAALFAFTITSTASLYLCERELNGKYMALKKAFEKQNYKEEKKTPRSSSSPPSPSP